MISASQAHTKDRANFSNDTDQELHSQFKFLADTLCSLFSDAGLKVIPYHAGLPYFSVLPTDKKQAILQHFQFFHDLCSAQLIEGKSLRDSKTFTWRALKALGLTPGCDFMQKISPGDMVEIYTASNNQIFRNLEFFEYCSYTLEELYCCEWWRLFERKESITLSLMAIGAELFAGEHPKGVHQPALSHTVKELSSFEKFQWNMDIKFVGPLHANKEVKALICISSMHSPTPSAPSTGLA